jgi:hypothetical protein
LVPRAESQEGEESEEEREEEYTALASAERYEDLIYQWKYSVLLLAT